MYTPRVLGSHSFSLVRTPTERRGLRLDRYAVDLEVFGVVMDDRSTRHDVPTYLERYDIDHELIRAEQFPRFAMAPSPSGLVPAVDKNGYVLAYQHGYSRRHLESLIHAVTVAEESR